MELAETEPEAAGLQMLGIVQEQHPDRARLFMQWKGMDWPVMVDAQNELGVRVVPITLLIDEHGIVRHAPSSRGDLKEILRAFVTEDVPPPDVVPGPMEPLDWDGLLEAASAAAEPQRGAVSVDALDALGRMILNAGGGSPGRSIDDAVIAFSRATEMAPLRGDLHFRLGVALRRRAESGRGRAGDFQAAVHAWQRALDLDPNQYIWRRRIQQYGPRLAKPYPFYDWVPAARDAIAQRGEVPESLAVEPSGAELAGPSRRFDPAAPAPLVGGDPQGRVTRDEGLVRLDATVVPSVVSGHESVRVHVRLVPDVEGDGYWNNEAAPLEARIKLPEGWEADALHRSVPNAGTAVSREPREVEFELRVPEAISPGRYTIRGYALYNACTGPDGICLFRRSDFTFDIEVR